MATHPVRTWCATVFVALGGVVGCAAGPAPSIAPPSLDGTTDASTTHASDPAPPTSAHDLTPQGFATTTALVTEPDGSTCEICVWVADDAERRARGLMQVTDLGAASAMAFVYPSPHTGTFWMKDTLLPLSIAFYSPTGEHITDFDMAPCSADPCPQYPTPADFLVAVEVPQGDLAALGLVAGSRFELLDTPCARHAGT